MHIILKVCAQDVIDEICEKLGSRTILDYEQRGIYENDDPIFDIELNSTICMLHVYPEWITIVRIDSDPLSAKTIADFRFEEVIIK